MSLMTDDTPMRLSQPGQWTMVIQAVPPSVNILRTYHWATYRKHMENWYYLIRGAQGFLDISRPLGKRYITIIRFGKRALDRDNVYGAMKPVIDVLKPEKHESGVWKSGPHKGKAWDRSRIGHGLILEDDEDHLDLKVLNGKLERGKKPYTTITISDTPI